MSDWERLETAQEETATAPAFTAEEVDEIVQMRGHTRKNKWAAPLGFLLLLLAAVGLFSMISHAVEYLTDTEHNKAVATAALKFLEPVTVQAPAAFDTIDDVRERDDLLLAAIDAVLQGDAVRQLQAHTAESAYPLDENGRYRIDAVDVEQAYAALFGQEAVPVHHTVGESENAAAITEYSEEERCYYVPTARTVSLYYTIPVKATLKKDTLTLTVGFVPLGNLRYDWHGDVIPPDEKAVTEKQVYTLAVHNADSGDFTLLSIRDEK